MDEKAKKLKKMATWTIAIFATIFAVTFAILWIPFYQTNGAALAAIGGIFSEAWVIILLDLVLCLGTYFGYKLYLDRKK
jgi:hypothetical protein